MRHVAIGLCRRPADGALLLEHGYDRIAGLRFYRAIGGACEPGEGPAAAVVREWREEFALAVRVGRALGEIDNRFEYEGRVGHELVSAFEVVPCDSRVYDVPSWEGVDPEGLRHTATWIVPETRAAAYPVYPAGVLALLRAAG